MEIIEGLSNEEYQQRPEISKGGLDRVHKSIAHFNNPQLRVETPQMALGTAFHCLVLEPDEFDKRYIEGPEGDQRTKAVKDKKLELLEKYPDKIILDADTFKQLMEMNDKLCEHPRMTNYFKDGQAELSMFWHINGVGCKARPDWFVQNNFGTFVIDVKTTSDASPEEFSKSVARFRYHVQAAWYLKAVEHCYGPFIGEEKPQFVFISVEKKKPYCIGTYVLKQSALDEGWSVADEDFRRYCDYHKAIKDGNEPPFEGYSEDTVEIDLPRWGYEHYQYSY